jgi:DNA polymerase-3 subunit gamma/tau
VASSKPAAAPSPCPAFEPNNADAVWAQIASRIDVREFLGRAVSKVSRTAISGPNQLEIFFPAAYHANKGLCEQPATLGRLEKIASEVAGKQVRVVCQLEADSSQTSQSEEITAESATPRTVAGKAENARQEQPNVTDPYVERARTIFGATIENVSVANHRSARGDESQSAPES